MSSSSLLSIPLLSPDQASDPISQTLPDYLGRSVVQILNNTEKNDPHRTSRRSLKVAVVIFSAAAKIPYWPISNKLGPGIGPICAGANSLAFFALEWWAGSKGLDDELGRQTHEEIAMLENKGDQASCKDRAVKIISISTATLVAAASQLPSALAGEAYNTQGLKVAAFVVLLVSGSLLPLRSIQLSLQALRSQSRDAVEQKLLALKADVITLVGQHGDVLQEVHNIEASSSQERYWSILLGQRDESKETKGQRVARLTGEVVGFGLNAFLQVSLGYLTYSITKEDIKDNDALGVTFATLAVTSTVYLTGTAIQKTAGKTFALVHSLLTGSRKPSLVEILKPRLAFAMQATGILIDLLAIGASGVIWSEFYSKSKGEGTTPAPTGGVTPEPEITPPTAGGVAAATAICTSIFFLLFTAMTDIIDNLTSSIILHKGNEEAKELLDLHKKLNRLARSVKKTPLFNFAIFVLELPEEVRDRYMRKFDLSIDTLNQYITKNSPVSEGLAEA